MKFSAILGEAGSGKTTRMRERARSTGESIKLTATTGIAAVNLGPSVTTLNSALGFYDEASLNIAKKTGKLRSRIAEVSRQYNTIAVDEISMLNGSILESLVNGFLQCEQQTGQEAPELLVLGDFLQLPPVSGSFAFDAPCWRMFEANMLKLEGSWRQKDDTEFYGALKAARAGNGVGCVLALRKAGVTYRPDVDENFNGTTITALNATVDKVNRERFALLSGVEQIFQRVTRGWEQSDWKALPARVVLKVGASVMILANMKDRETGELAYVNGDSGTVVEMGLGSISVELSRNGEIVTVPFVRRRRLVPDRKDFTDAVWDDKETAWEVGSTSYLPVRLAYASSIHKSQGLTLNRVQLDARTRFAGEPGMMYTALSRCRSAHDLVIVTKSPNDFARRINTHMKVRRWI
jgi:ATP-dependent DNA helicase PIF1